MSLPTTWTGVLTIAAIAWFLRITLKSKRIGL
jgi:hypothetical protein